MVVLESWTFIFVIFVPPATREVVVPRPERSAGGENARAAVPDQQVNAETPRYPVDRYLVERSNKLEMVNITDDDIWKAEPVLRPEDEIILRKLHDMLQSTADDLKLLSGELTKYHKPGVQVKSLPTPLDEEFNEKVHIEELVNAKFHGYNIVDKFQPTPANAIGGKVNGSNKSIASNTNKPNKVVDAAIQVNQMPTFRNHARKSNLTISRTKNIEINESINNSLAGNEENSRLQTENINQPTVAYKELSFKYVEPNVKKILSKPLQVQNMPSINIRSELREQKVLQLNIDPEAMDNDPNDVSKSNIAVISIRHEPISVSKTVPINQGKYPIDPTIYSKDPIRKYSKMSSCESSEVDIHKHNLVIPHGSREMRPCTSTNTVIKPSPIQQSHNIKNKRNINSKKKSAKHSNSNLDSWKKKLDAVYSCPTSSRKSKSLKHDTKRKKNESKVSFPSCSQPTKNRNTLNNAEYIPYSKLTLGGARVSDIEKELSGNPNINYTTLDPILNKILSRENSFHGKSPRFNINEESPNILTTSDENLLREVLDIERRVSKTLSKHNLESTSFNKEQPANGADEHESYADDFEDEKSDYSVQSENQKLLSDNAHSGDINLDQSRGTDSGSKSLKYDETNEKILNKTYTKTLNLSLKKHVDIFEFVHNVDTQDTGTQSNVTQKISLKETQTSPTNTKCNMQPIHNDLWPTIDPKGDVDKLFQLEKDFIKKLIVDEYGDLLDKNLNKPSTSKCNQSNDENNVTASQKNTQTSPRRVKNVMTSPTKTKTRTTSPFALSLTVDQQTSPIKEELRITVEDGDDLGLSINLSSPRFSLRLPQTSHDVLSNFESHARSIRKAAKNDSRDKMLSRKYVGCNSSSTDGNYSSSDISSLGEVRLKLKRFRKLEVPTMSELSSSTNLSMYSSDVSDAIVPVRSEGEVSLGQVNRRKSSKNMKSEGETSAGRLY